ncbi:MAG: sulfatase [Bacteroidota bacterium]
MRVFLLSIGLFFTLAAPAQRPNIIWIMAEDISIDLACYGMAAVKTPFLDQLAQEGTLYENAFCTASSCTPSRNAMLTGAYQTSTDTQDQRRGGITLPNGMYAFTKMLRDAGYYTALGCGYHDKSDHNFIADKYKPEDDDSNYSYLFDGRDWKERKEGQPFFAQITLPITHRWYSEQWPGIRAAAKDPIDTADVVMPPYFVREPVSLGDWVLYLEAIGKMDQQVGEIMDRLEAEGIAENTIVIFIGDNGRCHLRGKCWLYDVGIQVPLIIRWPNRVAAAAKNQELVSMLDITASILDVSDAEMPDYLDGQSIFDPKSKPRKYIFAARDMIGNAMDHIRCVRTKDFKYIRNYVPEVGYFECQYVRDNRPMLAVLEAMNQANELTPIQALHFAEEKPVEELYDVKNDPFEVNNLAELPEYQKVLKKMRKVMDRWIKATNDTGLDDG